MLLLVAPDTLRKVRPPPCSIVTMMSSSLLPSPMVSKDTAFHRAHYIEHVSLFCIIDK